MSIRARLILAVLTLVTAALLIADVATYASLNAFLTSRIDQQLIEAAGPTSHFLSENNASTRPPRGPSPFPPGTYTALLDSNGTVTAQMTFGFTASEQGASPRLPQPIPLPRGGTPILLTLPGGDTGPYRVGIMPGETSGTAVMVAIPLTDVDSTLNRLLLLEVGIGVAVLVLLAGLGAWAVRLGLRPLDRMAETAGAIAAGDLQRRVEPATPRTEVGRLGIALNTMLSKIEEAFAARTASEERLRRFVADASHELRTPVSSIRGYAELFRRGASANPEDLEMAMRRIEDEAARMGKLVDDLLLLTRLDEHRPMECAPVDLSTLAADAASDARAMDPTRKITLDAHDDVIVQADEARLRQVVANLLRNALVHTPAGTPIEVSADQKNGLGILTVVDHGPGISPEAKELIFERFYRADPARGRDRGSSGLGLSIAAGIVSAHGGEIRVTDTPGGGATFSLRLPTLVAADAT